VPERPLPDRKNTMYAVVSLWQLREDLADGALPEALVRQVRQAPGVVAGYWTYERSNGKSFGFTVVDGSDNAHELRRAIERHAETASAPGPLLEMVRVQRIVSEILASIP
jgi:hypothetical protein